MEAARRTATLNDQIKKAEIRTSAFMARHNVPFNLNTHLTKLMIKNFPDSKIAAGMKLGRTKSTAIVNNVVGAQSHENLIKTLKTTSFSLIIDESTDCDTQKHLCLVVRYFDKSTEKIRDQLLALAKLSDSTTVEVLFKAITSVFDSEGMQLSFCNFHHNVKISL